ncbi:ATP-binding protein [Bacillus sp. FJAT-47783]|uniref:ATP-binding protein n=1 Tax=Bacillus sp. FJAT-47783 TaxID=2922712 RepID=UPI00325FC67D
MSSTCTREFVERKENIIFLGNSGTKKTRLATDLEIAINENGYKMKFITTSELVEEINIANKN